MSFKIGFTAEPEKSAEEIKEKEPKSRTQAEKSLVKVYFEERNAAYTYYNDAFDLKCGDIVWVEGKLEGIRGRVIDVCRNFKIKLSDYKRVIGVGNTDIVGKFRLAGPFFFADCAFSYFDAVKTWYFPPAAQDEEIVCGSDGTSFYLNELKDMHIDAEQAQKSGEYFEQNKIAYIGISGGHGTAIVEGHKPYLVEFEYSGGQISSLTCECFETDACRHKFAAMLALRQFFDFVTENYKDIDINNAFSAIRKTDFFRYVIDTKNSGIFHFE